MHGVCLLKHTYGMVHGHANNISLARYAFGKWISILTATSKHTIPDSLTLNLFDVIPELLIGLLDGLLLSDFIVENTFELQVLFALHFLTFLILADLPVSLDEVSASSISSVLHHAELRLQLLHLFTSHS